MPKEQAELEVGSPAESSMYGKQDEYPTVYNLEGAEYFPYTRQKESSRWDYALPKTTLALGIVLILCCAGAAVAGYFAIQCHERARRCTSGEARSIPRGLNSTNVASPLVPSSSCSSLGPTYTSTVNDTKFTTQCETWYQGSDILGVYVHTFGACMDACASFNEYEYMHNGSRCYSVTYDATNENTGKGNCWLKAIPNIVATARNDTDSAVIE
ncbi:MAG: hypothetical protein Q9195_004413 [Heterodermia aff. obscurata]